MSTTTEQAGESTGAGSFVMDAFGGQAPPVRPAGSRANRYLSLDDFERGARKRLPRFLFSFVAGGAERETGIKANAESFDEHMLVPNVLRDTSGRHQATTLFGRTYAAPFGVAPMGIVAVSAYEGDLAIARACAAVDIPMVLSAASLVAMEQVRQAGAGWYQAYLPGDLGRIDPLIDRVAAAGFEVLVVTVDVPVPANRENNVRNNFSVPMRPTPGLIWEAIAHPRWLFGTALRTFWESGLPHFENMDATQGPPILVRDFVKAVGRRDRLTWEHIAHIRRRWTGPLVIKGILSPADARKAQDLGVDGLIVSNHGGRQLDGAASPLRMLPLIKDAASEIVLMLDGGVRRGTDVLKALALGARFVFVGRPFTYAATLGGAPFVRQAAELLMEEIDRDMALMGVTDLAMLGAAHLAARSSRPFKPAAAQDA